MRHLDLFSGIGGFALATEMVWGGDVEHIFCDNDPFSQAILKKHWPNSLIYGDIKELSAERIATDTERKRAGGIVDERSGAEEAHESADRKGARTGKARNILEGPRIDILTGGFPCQPFSAAGKREGTKDDRHLWPDMLRIIRECNPRYILGENVSGLLTWNGGLVFEQVCTDLEGEGYQVCSLVVPACGVNAPHRRDRVWIAAFKADAPHTKDALGRAGRISKYQATIGASRNNKSSGIHSDVADTNTRRIQRYERPSIEEGPTSRSRWEEDWFTVASRLCAMDDGIPGGVARPRGWRNAALKGAGNAIVPQVAAEIMRGMREIEKQ